MFFSPIQKSKNGIRLMPYHFLNVCKIIMKYVKHFETL